MRNLFGLDPQAKEREPLEPSCPADLWRGTSVFFSRLFVVSLVVFVGLMVSFWFDLDDICMAAMYLINGAFAFGSIYFVGWCVWKYIRFRLSLPKIQVENLYFTDVRCEDGRGITVFCRMDAGFNGFVWQVRGAIRVKDSSITRDRAASMLRSLLPKKEGERVWLPRYGELGTFFRSKCGFFRLEDVKIERPELKDRFAVSVTDVISR